MQIEYTYRFANGESFTLTLNETDLHELLELDRREYNNNHRETRRHASLDYLNPNSPHIKEEDDPADIYEAKESASELYLAIRQLLPEQQLLIFQVFFDGVTLSEIAKRDGVSLSAISHRIARALRRLKEILG